MLPGRGAVAAVHLIKQLSIVIPTLNEAAGLRDHLEALQVFRKAGHEVILVDGGSSDNSQQIATPLVDIIVESPAGRATQMNSGAAKATGDLLLFLHADTVLPLQTPSLIAGALCDGTSLGGPGWGRFDVRLSGNHPMLRIVERLMNWRSCLTGIATGDQAMFMTKQIFQQVGGFPEIALMEDIEISKRLKQKGRPACIDVPVITSSRRWEQRGILRTILLMWRIRLAYFFGATPEQLSSIYRQAR